MQKRVKAYMIAFPLLETLMIGVFCAPDIAVLRLRGWPDPDVHHHRHLRPEASGHAEVLHLHVLPRLIFMLVGLIYLHMKTGGFSLASFAQLEPQHEGAGLVARLP